MGAALVMVIYRLKDRLAVPVEIFTTSPTIRTFGDMLDRMIAFRDSEKTSPKPIDGISNDEVWNTLIEMLDLVLYPDVLSENEVQKATLINDILSPN